MYFRNCPMCTGGDCIFCYSWMECFVNIWWASSFSSLFYAPVSTRWGGLYMSGFCSWHLGDCLLVSWLWRPGDLAFLVPWDCNNWYHPGKTFYPWLVLWILWLLPGDISTLNGSGASGAYTHGSHRTKTKGDRVTESHHSQGIARGNRLRNLIILWRRSVS